MIDFINSLGTEYGGILALAGLILGVAGVFYGVYARVNPKTPVYRISYKIFCEGLTRFRTSSRLSRHRRSTFKTYIDVWNSGSAPIDRGVIRETLAIALQNSRRPSRILRSSVVEKETHPTISAFKIDLEDEGARLRIDWAHFDPGMAARIVFETEYPTSSDEVALFGSGYKLGIQRIVPFMQRKGLVYLFVRALLVFTVPIVFFSLVGGYALVWFQSLEIPESAIFALPLPVLAASMMLLIVSVFIGVMIVAGAERLLDVQSPVQKRYGYPPNIEKNFSVSFSSGRDIADLQIRDEIYSREMAEQEARLSDLEERSRLERPYPSKATSKKPRGLS